MPDAQKNDTCLQYCIVRCSHPTTIRRWETQQVHDSQSFKLLSMRIHARNKYMHQTVRHALLLSRIVKLLTMCQRRIRRHCQVEPKLKNVVYSTVIVDDSASKTVDEPGPPSKTVFTKDLGHNCC